MGLWFARWKGHGFQRPPFPYFLHVRSRRLNPAGSRQDWLMPVFRVPGRTICPGRSPRLPEGCREKSVLAFSRARTPFPATVPGNATWRCHIEKGRPGGTDDSVDPLLQPSPSAASGVARMGTPAAMASMVLILVPPRRNGDHHQGGLPEEALKVRNETQEGHSSFGSPGFQGGCGTPACDGQPSLWHPPADFWQRSRSQSTAWRLGGYHKEPKNRACPGVPAPASPRSSYPVRCSEP